MSNEGSHNVFVVFGPQGSGKSTQVEFLANKYSLTIFEAGEVLREKAKVDEELHQKIKRGELVPDELLYEYAQDFVESHPSENGYLFDGYPRNIDQCQGFQKLAQTHGWKVVAIYIHLSDESAKERLSKRFTIVNGEKVMLEDDKPEIVQKRLDTFKRETLPMKQWFKNEYSVLDIDGEPSVEEVTELINKAVEDYLHE